MSKQMLKPCPFCGSSDIDAAFAKWGDGAVSPGCMSCGATANTQSDWNDRASPQSSAESAQPVGPFGRENDAFHRALSKYPASSEALHSFWNDAFGNEPQSAPTREEIENIKTAILEDTTALNDTLWMPDHIFKGGSVVDYIDAILSRSQAVIEHGPVAAIVLRAMQSKADPEIYGASHALKINTDRASKAADEIIALTRPMRQDAEKTGEGQ